MARAFPDLDVVTGQYSEPADDVRREWVARTFSRTVGAVCGSCNNGWMSEIEAQAKPLLEKLFVGRPLKLGRQRQATLAIWAMVKALVHTHAEVKPNPIPRSHYEEVYKRTRLPEGTAVWLGAHTPRQLDPARQLVLEGRSQTLEPFADSSAEVIAGFVEGHAYGWTLSFGVAAFQLFGSDFLDMVELDPSTEARPALRRIHPQGYRVAWPPPRTLKEAVGDLPELPRSFLPRTE